MQLKPANCDQQFDTWIIKKGPRETDGPVRETKFPAKFVRSWPDPTYNGNLAKQKQFCGKFLKPVVNMEGTPSHCLPSKLCLGIHLCRPDSSLKMVIKWCKGHKDRQTIACDLWGQMQQGAKESRRERADERAEGRADSHLEICPCKDCKQPKLRGQQGPAKPTIHTNTSHEFSEQLEGSA